MSYQEARLQLGFPENQNTVGPGDAGATTTPPTPLPEGLSETAATAAVTWGNTQGYDPDAIRDLQKTLSAPVTGVYDRDTAIAVFNAQSASARKSSPAKADRFLFMQLGLIPYKDQTVSTGDTTLAQLKKIAPNGINVGIATDYKKRDGNNIEITRKSAEWAKAFNGVGITDNALTIGTINPIKHIEDVVSAIRSIHDALLAAHRAENPSDTTIPAWCKIRNLALFSHGMEYGVSLDETNTYSRGLHNTKRNGRESNVEAFVRGVSGALTKDVQVQLYACNAGRDIELLQKYKGKRDSATYREWVDHDEGERRGEGSFADDLNIALEGAGHESTVYAHTTAGHTTENFAARVYGKEGNQIGAEPAGGGRKAGSPHMFDVLYGEAFLLQHLSALGVSRAGVSYAAVRAHKSSAAVASQIREIAWRHYKDSITNEHKRSGSSKRYKEPIGRLMFMDPAAARTLLHADFSTWAQSRLSKISVPQDAKTAPTSDTPGANVPTIE